MADSPVLPTPVVRVFMDDGSVLEVQAYNKDLLAFDRIRARRGWPTAADAPQPWITFIAYTALGREGLIPQMSLDDFENRALAVTVVNDKAGAQAVGNPTRQEAEPS